jgi:hypothetical protein
MSKGGNYATSAPTASSYLGGGAGLNSDVTNAGYYSTPSGQPVGASSQITPTPDPATNNAMPLPTQSSTGYSSGFNYDPNAFGGAPPNLYAGTTGAPPSDYYNYGQFSPYGG